jgi:hypothetical protein
MTRDRIALVALIAQLAAVLWLTPGSVLHAPAEPTSFATFCTVIVTLGLLASRLAGTTRYDRLVLALFLAGMQVIYVWAAILRADGAALGVEALGLLAFAGMALAGYARWPWLLGVGILAHGFAWDCWHHGHASYIPDWYSLGCLVTDLGVGVFALLRSDARRRAARPDAAPARTAAEIAAAASDTSAPRA